MTDGTTKESAPSLCVEHTHMVHLLLQLDSSLGEGINFVLLYLQVIHCLLLGFLQGLLLLD